MKIKGKTITAGDLDIHYLTGGQGEPIIVVHGGGRGSRAWLKNATLLASNYTVYVPDLPGFGQTNSSGDYYSIPGMVGFLDKFSRSLGLEKFYLMGHSVGGGVALSYALKFPQKVSKLVLVSSLCLGKEVALWIRILANRPMCRYVGKAVLTMLRGVKWLAKALVSVVFIMPVSEASIALGSCITTFQQQTTVLSDRLSEVIAPTLIVWGEKDPIVPYKHAYEAANLVSNCKVKVFKGAGHSVYHEKLEEFSLLLKDFLG